MKTVLVVEDDFTIREEICDTLLMENYNVLKAEDGEEGFKKASRLMPNLIISDISMPKVNGYQLISMLKNNKKTKRIPVIFLSALSYVSDIRKGMNLGAYDYLPKPVSSEKLILSVKNNLEKFETVNAEIETFIYDLSFILAHELKTPLNGMLGFAELLADKNNIFSRNEISTFAKHIFSSTLRLNELVEDYLLFSELKMHALNSTSIRNIFKLEVIQTHEIIEEVVKNLSEKYNRSEDITTEATVTSINYNKTLFKKIVTIVLDNAYKFSAKGNKVKLISRQLEDGFLLQVLNDGIGIKEENISKISPFIQFDRKIQEQQGSGLGLAILKMIAEQTNLKIEIKSNYKKDFFISVLFIPADILQN